MLAAGSMNLEAQEGRTTAGMSIDFVSGGTSGQNPAGITLPGKEAPGSFFYEAYPNITLKSTGRRSTFDTSYTFGFSQFKSDLSYNSNSHAGAMAYTSSLGRSLKITLSDAFQLTSNAATFNGVREVSPSPTVFSFLIDSAALSRSSRTNTATVAADYAVSDRSTIVVNASYVLLKYGGPPSLAGTISNQQRTSENITYSKSTTSRGTWSVAYSTTYMSFNQFDDGRSHAASVGYSYRLPSGFDVNVSGGPTYVQSKGAVGNYSSYNTRVTVGKLIKANAISINYAHESGGTAGVGSIADNDRAGFGLKRTIFKDTSAFVDVSAFNTRSKLSDTLSLRGVAATASFGVPAGRYFSLHWGGQYQRYAHTALFPFEQKRVYISVQLNVPELWKY